MTSMMEFVEVQRGSVIRREDDGYNQARAVYNAMIDKYPAVIAQCANAADVIRAVNFAREQGLDIAVRSGGHNGGGLGTVDDGLVIDLSGIRYVRVDPMAKTARVGGGSLWGDVDAATHAFGLAVPSGIISTTGVGGLTLGGGMGHLTRRYGLTIDNLLEADMVLADGSFVTVNESSHPDLFWAIRGGGGNFGVVTSFLFRLHEVSTLIAGPMLWEMDDAPAVLRWYADWIGEQPETISAFFMFMTVPGPPFPEPLHGKKMCGLMWACTGSQAQAEAALDVARAAAPIAFEHVGPMPVPTLQSMFDPLYPAGHQWYWKADFVKKLPEAAIEAHVKYGNTMPTPQSSMHLYPINGAAGRVAPDATAWAHRDAQWGMVIVGVDPDPTNNDRIISWTLRILGCHSSLRGRGRLCQLYDG